MMRLQAPYTVTSDMSHQVHAPREDITEVRQAMPGTDASRPLCLVLFHGPDAPRVVVLDRPLTIGRGASCDIPLDDASASRIHAQIAPAGGQAEIADVATAFARAVASSLAYSDSSLKSE
jgi:hypothetical protein